MKEFFDKYVFSFKFIKDFFIYLYKLCGKVIDAIINFLTDDLVKIF